MKKLILSLLFIAISIQGVAGFTLTQSQKIKPSFIAATNDPIDSVITTDNQGGKSKYVYHYDENRKTTFVLQKKWTGSEWADYYKKEYSYDSLMNLTGIVIMAWDMFGEQWVNFERYTYTYDENGNRLTDLGEGWTGSYWYVNRNRIYTFDSLNNLSTYTLKEGPGYYYEYSYDTNNNLAMTVEFVGQDDWQKHYRYSYSYGTTDKPSSLLIEEWGDQWNKYQSTEYEYNSYGNIISEILKNWDSFNLLWVNGKQNTFTYNANNNLIEELIKQWNGTEWVNSVRNTYAYNSDGNINTFLTEYWYNNNWASSVKDFDFDDYYGNRYSFRTARIDIYYGSLMGVEQQSTRPIKYSLSQNYPNPFNPTTKITYSIPTSGHVTIKIYDILGSEIATLVNAEQMAGMHEIQFNASSLSSGEYFYTMQSANFKQTKKIILLK